eukprot:CAMPEP_0194276984 /NCGR_PEP_ID=MMETSP0169-20130528/9426_1 /TAXON_ID=218684 /ORGANISM="Corethron pennatum, Strain L29A3" /LENGTH=80 /DNA_ID=CAMNT_0039020831 /DNA_START=99 /DNA_END=338 /DNA_ORIENTATION=-
MSSEAVPPFAVGALVSVAARMVVGKPPMDGGVGKITRVDVPARTLDVRYVLGGRERDVDWKHVSRDLYATGVRKKAAPTN